MKQQRVVSRRTEILETTCEVVIERGFAATRISDVAKRLLVSTSLIHYHFDSKEQLLAEAFAHYARKDLILLEDELRNAPNTVAQLDRFLQDSVPEGSDDMEWMLWIDAWGEALRNPLMRSISQELDRQSLAILEQIITAGVERGEMTCDAPPDAAERITSLIDGLAVQFAAHDGVLSRERLLAHLRTAAAREVGLGVADLEAAHGPGHGDPTATAGPAAPLQPRAHDEAAIGRLVQRASDALARHDASAWTALWAAPSAAPPIDEAHAVVELCGATLSELDPSGSSATARTVVQRRPATGGDPRNPVWGIYHDRLIRSSGGWRFTERRLEVLDSD